MAVLGDGGMDRGLNGEMEGGMLGGVLVDEGMEGGIDGGVTEKVDGGKIVEWINENVHFLGKESVKHPIKI